MTRPPHLFCFGFGYTAKALALALLREGFAVSGTVRNEPARQAMEAEGVRGHVFDRAHPIPDIRDVLAPVTHILSSVPPDEQGDPVMDVHGADIAEAGPGLEWIGYLSTTAVYGDRGGGWVDEESPLEPTGERGRRRVAAEARWLDLWWDEGLPVHVFRLAGIYGPGRSALEQVRAGRGRRVVKAGQVFSRIHVEDVAAVLRASLARPDPGRIYNVCDDEPAPPQDVIAFACGLLGVEPPPLVPFAEAELGEMGRSFYADNKRVRNDRIKRELGVRLEYPDYRVGLRALLAGGGSA